MTLLCLALCLTERPFIAPRGDSFFSQRLRVSPYLSPHSFQSVSQGQVINFNHAIFSTVADAMLGATTDIVVAYEHYCNSFVKEISL